MDIFAYGETQTFSATGPRQPRPMTIFRAARILGKPSAISSSGATAGATLCAARSALLPQPPCSAPPRLPQAAPRQKPRPTASTSRSSTAGIDANHHVAPGYRGQVLLRWGDPLFADSPAFDPTAQSAAAQLKQFGYNNDYVAFFPLDEQRQARPPLRQSRIHQRRGDVPRHQQAPGHHPASRT